VVVQNAGVGFQRQDERVQLPRSRGVRGRLVVNRDVNLSVSAATRPPYALPTRDLLWMPMAIQAAVVPHLETDGGARVDRVVDEEAVITSSLLVIKYRGVTAAHHGHLKPKPALVARVLSHPAADGLDACLRGHGLLPKRIQCCAGVDPL